MEEKSKKWSVQKKAILLSTLVGLFIVGIILISKFSHHSAMATLILAPTYFVTLLVAMVILAVKILKH